MEVLYCCYIQQMPDSISAEVNARNMWETYLPVFRACVVEAQGAHVMCSYNAVNGVPACANGPLLNGILRDQWKWPGMSVLSSTVCIIIAM